MPGMPMHGKSKKLTGAQHQSSIKKTPKHHPLFSSLDSSKYLFKNIIDSIKEEE